MAEGVDMAKDRTHLHLKGFSATAGAATASFGKVIVTDNPPPRPPRPKRFIDRNFKLVRLLLKEALGLAIRGTIWDSIKGLFLGRKRQPAQGCPFFAASLAGAKK